MEYVAPTGLEIFLVWVSTKISRLRRWASTLENFFAVKLKKIYVRLGQFFRQPNRFALERNEILFQRWLWKETPQPLAQHNAQFVIERDKSGIESRVVKC